MIMHFKESVCGVVYADDDVQWNFKSYANKNETSKQKSVSGSNAIYSWLTVLLMMTLAMMVVNEHA